MGSVRPAFVQWAVILTVINAVGGVVFSALWPDLEDRGTVLSVSIVVAVLMLAAAYFLWNGKRWGGWAVIVLNVLNIISALPAYFVDDADDMVVGATISIALSLATLVLLWMPEARAYWNGRERALAT